MTPDPSSPRRPAPLLSLQVLRAVAALLVLVHHAAYDADTIAARSGAAPLAADRFFDFGFGIHLFFVVSGFIMLRTARGFGSARGAAVFLARRVVRVVPLYWLMTSLVLVGTAVAPQLLNTPPGGRAVILGSYLFVPVLRAGGELRPVLGQGWTLDYEMFFYLLFALAMLLPRRAAPPALAAAILGLVALGTLVPAPAAAVAVWTNGLLLEFLFGLGLGFAAGRGAALGAGPAAALMALGFAAAAAFGPPGGLLAAAPGWLSGGVPAGLVVAGCVLGPRWRASRPVLALAVLGDASYSLYLSHPFAVRLLRGAWFGVAPRGAPPWLYFALACAAAVAAALVLHRAVERPMTDWLQRRSGLAGADPRPILPEAAAAPRGRGRGASATPS